MEGPDNKILTGDLIKCDNKAKWTVESINNINFFTKEDIERITNNYSTLIGKGGFGEVYRGVLDNDQNLVAVKKYIRGDLREEFMEEVSIHSQIKHKNVVKLIGCCIQESTLMIVTEYISKGNLDDMLHNNDVSIPLDTRLDIAIGCAEALSYMHLMHLSSDSLVYHGDIKPANILLDDNLIAKISDFGLARHLSGDITRYTKNVKGSLDYMDPMYLREGCLTPKSDVYSFGVVLLELIARKRVKQGEINLIGAFSKARGKGKQLRELFDSEIANEINMKSLEEIEKLATECLALDTAKRPQMSDVSKRLHRIRKVQKGGQKKISWLSFWRTQNKLRIDSMKETTSYSSEPLVEHNKIMDVSKRGSGNYKVLEELSTIRKFKMDELTEITENYLHLLGTGGLYDIYKGTLEDNTPVVVKKYWQANEAQQYEFFKAALSLSQISHKNIAKLIGCCMEEDIPIFVYKHATKGSLHAILQGNEDIPLELRMKIAVNTAKGLEYLHLSGTSLIRRGYFVPSDILLDDNFTPTIIPDCFSLYSCFARTTNTTHLANLLSVQMNYLDPIFLATWCLTENCDVYSFGITLMELISRKVLIMYDNRYRHLVPEFIGAYRTFGSGRVMFDEDITDEENIVAFEVIGKLALTCISLEEGARPSMKEVVECLEMLMGSWKKQPADPIANDDGGTTEGTEPDAPVGSETKLRFALS